MEWLTTKKEEMCKCLRYLRIWIGSIYMHTYDESKGKCAPFILIGTHKDKVSSPKQHHDIDYILNETFKGFVAWNSRLDNHEGEGGDGRENLCFYAVDNTKGREDPVLLQAMSCIENEMNEAEYTHVRIPAEWLAFMDRLKDTKKSFF